MPMTQEDIKRHYEQNWQQTLDRAQTVTDLAYSNPLEDAVLYPEYEALLRDCGAKIDGGRVLDVGCGSGRWVRFFLSRFQPQYFLGVDFAAPAIDLLKKWHPPTTAVTPDFRVADITQPGLNLGGKFDVINIANVLFHIPEQDRFLAALHNLSAHLAPNGRIFTTEYLPRASRRTNWMLVRSRYEFADAAAVAGLQVAEVRPTGFFNNDPLGIDGPDAGARQRFNAVRAKMQTLFESCTNAESRRFVLDLFIEIEQAAVEFAAERVAPMDFPTQKLVVLTRAA